MRASLCFTLVVLAAGCGSNTADVRCGEAPCAANQRCDAKQLVCVLDEAPSLSITSPSEGAIVTGDSLTVTGTVRDDSGPASLELSTDDGNTWSKVEVTGSGFNAKVGLPILDFQAFKVSLRATDSRQQSKRASVGVTVDNVAPIVTLAAPADGAKLGAAWFANTPAVTGTATDASGQVTVTVDTGTGDQPALLSNAAFSFAWTAPAAEDAVAHDVEVIATDAAGNSTTVVHHVVVDVVPPSLTFATPAAGALLGPGFFLGGAKVQGAVSPATSVTVDFGSGPQPASVTSGQWSATYPQPANADSVPVTFKVVATDDAGNETRTEQTVTVDVVAPVLHFTSPAMGAKLNAAAFAAGDDVPISWSVTDGDTQAVVRNGTTVIAGTTLAVTTSPTDNPKSYAVSLTVSDRAGNSAQAQLSFAVDRVRPTVAAGVPADGSRNNGRSVSIDFSEDVQGGDGFALTPTIPGGAWTTARHFEATGLAPDTVYARTVGAVADSFGNPVVAPASARFHTAPMLPVSGATLMGNVWQFKAAVDPDGVLSLFTTSPTSPAEYRWVRVNPKSGQIEDNRFPWAPALNNTLSVVDAYASSSVNADLSARRFTGAFTLHPGAINEQRIWTRFDDDTAGNQLGMVGLISTRAIAAEGSNLGEIAPLKLSSNVVSYSRPGLTDLAVGLNPTAVGASPVRWELIEARNAALKRRTFGCTKYFANQPAVCELTATSQWNDVSTDDQTSYAMGNSCSVYVYNTNIGTRLMHVEPYAPACAGFGCPSGWISSSALSSELKVATDRQADNSFLGAMRVPGGVQMMRLALNGSCQGAWANLGAPIAVPLTGQFQPISLGGKPALVFVDSGSALKVTAP